MTNPLPRSDEATPAPRESRKARLARQAWLHDHPWESDGTRRNAIAIYQRYSDKKQSENSIRRQDDVTSAVAERLGAPIHRVYVDRARTGMTAYGRTELNDLLHDAEAGLFNKLVVENLDRVGRELYIIHMLCKRLAAVGVAIYDMSGAEITDVSLTFKALISVAERATMLDRTYEGRKNAVRRGVVPHRIRFGYALDPRRVDARGARMPHPQRAAAVREIFEAYDSGPGLSEVAARMTGRWHTPGDCRLIDAAILDPQSHPLSPWTAEMVEAILTCFTYKGVLLDCVTMVQRDHVSARVTGYLARPPEDWARAEVPHLAIVSAALFDRCYLKLMRARGEGQKSESIAKYLLTERARCGRCGKALESYQQRGERRYRCPDDRLTCEGVGRPTVASIECGVLKELERIVIDQEFASLYAETLESHAARLCEQVAQSRAGLEEEDRRLAERARFAREQAGEFGFNSQRRAAFVREAEKRREDVARQIALLTTGDDLRPSIMTARLAEAFAAMRTTLPFRGRSVLPSGDTADPLPVAGGRLRWDPEARALVRAIRDIVARVLVVPPDLNPTTWLRIELTLGGGDPSDRGMVLTHSHDEAEVGSAGR